MDPLPWCLLVHALATGVMTGLIWFVQVVHYPLFAEVARQGGDDQAFGRYESVHQKKTTLIVLPTMTVELITAGLLVYWLAPGPQRTLALIALGVLLLIWLSTFAIQVPCHEKLSQGFNEQAHRRLVHSNWLRTVGWSGRFVAAVWLVAGG